MGDTLDKGASLATTLLNHTNIHNQLIGRMSEELDTLVNASLVNPTGISICSSMMESPITK